jgi:hypothetical protein
MSPEFGDKHDDRALEKILLDGLGLQKPPTADDWKRIAYRSMASPLLKAEEMFKAARAPTKSAPKP